MLTVMFGVKKYQHYMVGRHTIIKTNHASLKWLTATKDTEGQLTRWIQYLDMFNHTIVHHAGRQHSNTDGLSRLPLGGHCDRVTTQSEDSPETERWRVAQANDGLLARVRRWRGGEEMGDLRRDCPGVCAYAAQLERLEERQGLLTRRWIPPTGPELYQTCVPNCLKEEAMRACHGAGLQGHFGVRRTVAKCQTMFYWPDYWRDLTAFIAECIACARRKSPPIKARAPMGHVPASQLWIIGL